MPIEKYGKGESRSIPYRCLTPKGLQNLLVAGRCIATDKLVNASTRIQGACLATGEAAGLAAALTTMKLPVDVHRVKTDLLRKRLREEGQYLL